MLCEKCNKNNATLYVNEYKDGKMTEAYLCTECANIQNSISDYTQPTFQNFLTSLLGMTMGSDFNNLSETQSNTKIIQCANCKMTDHEFKNTGRFGCSECYETFDYMLESALKKIQPSSKHTGKVPSKLAHIFTIKREIESLKNELSEAIKQEEYEKAADIRDRIRGLEKGGDNNE